VGAVLLAADGPSFCAGIDLALLAELAPMVAGSAEQPDTFRSLVSVLQRPYLALARMPKPTLAAIQGHALGAGFQLGLACDLRVAASDVRFGMLEGRYGLIPDLGGMHHLARLVGPSRTKELVWTTRTVEGAEAERIGLVNRLVDGADLPAAAEELLRRCIAHSVVAVALTKEVIAATFARSFAEELDREASAQVTALGAATSPDP